MQDWENIKGRGDDRTKGENIWTKEHKGDCGGVTRG